MVRFIRYILLLSVAVAMWSCGGGDSFRITGEIPGIGTQNLNVVYYADGSYHATRTAVVDGKFMFDGVSRDWTAVYIFTNARALLGVVIIRNGENVDAKFELNNPGATVLKGTSPSEKLSEWYSQYGTLLNEGDAEAINRSIKDFVVKNPDNMASTVVLTTYYRADENPSQADSLLQSISSKVRQGNLAEGWADRVSLAMDSSRIYLAEQIQLLDSRDTLRTLKSREGTLVLYNPGNRERNNSSEQLLRKAVNSDAKDSLKIEFYEVNTGVGDTLAWKTDIRDKDLPWKRLWHPLNSGKIPFEAGECILVTDSTGRIIYNGPDIEKGLKIANLL